MAAATKTRKPRVAKVYPEEQAIENHLTALAEKVKKANRETTDHEKKQAADWRKELGALKFKRLAKQRAVKAVLALRNLAKLTGRAYTRTPEQVENIGKQLSAEVATVVSALAPTASGAKKEEVVFDL